MKGQKSFKKEQSSGYVSVLKMDNKGDNEWAEAYVPVHMTVDELEEVGHVLEEAHLDVLIKNGGRKIFQITPRDSYQFSDEQRGALAHMEYLRAPADPQHVPRLNSRDANPINKHNSGA